MSIAFGEFIFQKRLKNQENIWEMLPEVSSGKHFKIIKLFCTEK